MYIPSCHGMITQMLGNCVKCKKERDTPESLLSEFYPRKGLRLVKNPIATFELIASDDTLSQKKEKQDQLNL